MGNPSSITRSSGRGGSDVGAVRTDSHTGSIPSQFDDLSGKREREGTVGGDSGGIHVGTVRVLRERAVGEISVNRRANQM